MRQLTSALIALMLCSLAANARGKDAEMDRFVDSLMNLMTVDEKIGQLNMPVADDIFTGQARKSDIGRLAAEGKVGAVLNVKGAKKINELQRVAVEESRLGIPILVGMDVIHGYETVFPIPLALSCSWDMEVIEQSARIAAKEASAAGVAWTFSPMVDISRDPRWGRVAEGAGEDPLLGSRVARAMVRGYQGDLSADDNIMACVKHFALYGAVEAGREYNTVDMSRIRMYNDYFPPYRAAVEEGALSVMSAFNLIDEVPATANRWLLTDVLRDQWGFDGFVVTDFNSVGEIADHGVADIDEASALALKAGTDLDMASLGFVSELHRALDEGRVSQQDIDTACRRILEAKYRLGLFANPYKYGADGREETEIYTDENRRIARDIAAKTFVLLKNEGDLLPVRKNAKVALVGPLADAGRDMFGMWTVAADFHRNKSLRESFGEVLADAGGTLLYAKGCNLFDDEELQAKHGFAHYRDQRSAEEMIAEAVALARDADIVVAAMGEALGSTGECSSRSDLETPESQRRLLQALLDTGKPLVVLNFTGRPTLLQWEDEHVPAMMNVWFGGSEAADAVADVVFGDKAPSGKLTMTFPRNMGQIPLYYNHRPTGRPLPEGSGYSRIHSNYIDVPNSPLYPFGYGLSYNRYEYSDFALSADELSPDGAIEASVTVTNCGDMPGDEIVQLYTHDVRASVSRPVKELKDFRRITLQPGESRRVTFTITPDMLRFYNSELEYVWEPGAFEAMIGPNSRDLTALPFRLTR